MTNRAKNNYWYNTGAHQHLIKVLDALVPAEGRCANPKKNPPRKSKVGIPSRASRARDSPLSEGTSKSRSTEMNDSKAVAKKSHGKKRKKTLEVCKVMEF
jgi:hypothetical protein